MLTLMEGETVESLYSAFCDRDSRVIQAMRPDGANEADRLDVALEFAIIAASYHAGCVAILKAEDEANGPDRAK